MSLDKWKKVYETEQAANKVKEDWLASQDGWQAVYEFYDELEAKKIKSKNQRLGALMEDWLADPSWDIEDTPGFEDCRQEILRFCQEVEQRARESEKKFIDKIKNDLEIGTMLASYIRGLILDIESLRERIKKLEEKE